MQFSSTKISDLGRKSLVSKLGNFGEFTHVFFVDRDVSVLLTQVNISNVWLDLYFADKLYPVNDIILSEDMSSEAVYDNNIFDEDELISLGKKNIVFSLMPTAEKIRELSTLTNQYLSFYLGDAYGQIYGLSDGINLLPFPADLIALEAPKFGQGATPTFTKLRTQIEDAAEFVEKFYTQEVDFLFDDIDKQIVDITMYIYSQTNVRLKVSHRDTGIIDIQAGDITFNDNRYGELSVSIIENSGNGNYSLIITDGILTDGSVSVLSRKYIGCSKYIVTSVTIVVVNYVFEDGENYDFENGINFDFNG